MAVLPHHRRPRDHERNSEEAQEGSPQHGGVQRPEPNGPWRVFRRPPLPGPRRDIVRRAEAPHLLRAELLRVPQGNAGVGRRGAGPCEKRSPQNRAGQNRRVRSEGLVQKLLLQPLEARFVPHFPHRRPAGPRAKDRGHLSRKGAGHRVCGRNLQRRQEHVGVPSGEGAAGRLLPHVQPYRARRPPDDLDDGAHVRRRAPDSGS